MGQKIGQKMGRKWAEKWAKNLKRGKLKRSKTKKGQQIEKGSY